MVLSLLLSGNAYSEQTLILCTKNDGKDKGFSHSYLIDTEKKQTIGLIRHSFINDTKYSSKMDFLIFSKNHKTFEEVPIIFIEMVKEWVTTSHMNEPPSKVRFIGSDDKIVEITNKY